MIFQSTRKFLVFSFLALACFLLAACSLPGSTSDPTTTPAPPTFTPTPLPTVTPTPPPLAASVNGEYILLADYTAEMARYQAGLQEGGKEAPSAEVMQTTVLDALINETLLAQAAYTSGFTLSDADLQTRLDKLIQDAGGNEAFTAWLNRLQYTPETFRTALKRSIAAAWQRNQLGAAIPAAMEQIHARQMLVDNETTANQLFAQLQNGAEFATLAAELDPTTGGELGWFPRGYLFIPALEEAAFTLQPGQYSSVIHSDYGYHILYIVAREEHPLSLDARRSLQAQAVQTWLTNQRTTAQIQISLP